MSRNRREFPRKVKSGSVILRIYQVRNKAYRVNGKEKEQFSFRVSFFIDGQRHQQMFAEFEDAYAEAESEAGSLSRETECAGTPSQPLELAEASSGRRERRLLPFFRVTPQLILCQSLW